MTATYDTILQFKSMLKNLDQCMKKASAYADLKKFDVNVFVETRLAPDMHGFDSQIQSACDTAKFCAAYLTETPPPKHEDTEETWAQLHERIGKVITYLETFKGSQFEKSADVIVKPNWAKGKWMKGSDFVQQVSIPNFYFHVTTAYAILRNNGVDVGKMDYLGNVNFSG